jgi:inhibitor of the pro-sigma K processing machinery
MIGTVILMVVGIIILIGLWYIIKNILQLVLNSILGLILLFCINYFHLFQILGKPDLEINLITVLVCALAGIPGAVLLVLLHLVGLA